jgi:hypothetical protein
MSLPKPSVYPGPLYNEDGGSIFLRTEAAYFSGTLALTYHTIDNIYSPDLTQFQT